MITLEKPADKSTTAARCTFAPSGNTVTVVAFDATSIEVSALAVPIVAKAIRIARLRVMIESDNGVFGLTWSTGKIPKVCSN